MWSGSIWRSVLSLGENSAHVRNSVSQQESASSMIPEFEPPQSLGLQREKGDWMSYGDPCSKASLHTLAMTVLCVIIQYHPRKSWCSTKAGSPTRERMKSQGSTLEGQELGPQGLVNRNVQLRVQLLVSTGNSKGYSPFTFNSTYLWACWEC